MWSALYRGIRLHHFYNYMLIKDVKKVGYTALYRKFRPTTFGEVVGQEHITRTLKNQIIADRVGHAYLFNGGRGTGKTSSAKILARAINCLNPEDGEPCNECEICKSAINGSLTDIVEMDAASNNSVEDIRSIREEVNFLPTKAKYRVYIIDEVHMLSTGAFNALLKTLEEPPEHVKFILATTEPQKLPATILSRCQRFDFKRISNEDIIKRLKVVSQESDINITDGALNIIAVLSEGAMRDALSILERCVQDGQKDIDEDKIKDLVGIPKITFVHNILNSIIEHDAEGALKGIEDVLNEGKDLNNFIWEMIKYTKDVLVYKTSKKSELYDKNEIKNIEKLANKTEKERLVNLIYELSSLEADMKWSTQKSIVFQAGIIKLCNVSTVVTQIVDNSQTNYSTPVENKVVKNIPTTNTDIKKNATVNNVTKPKVTASMPEYKGGLNKSWPKIVNDLKQNGKMVLATNLKGTKAEEINDMTVGIKFPNGLSSFGKTILEKQENVREISKMVSIACGKEMQIKYIAENSNQTVQTSPQDDIQKIANQSDIPFNIIE